ncbi:trypsin-like peptidase domain-containing protein [bacterium]|nr:trypsin-like peptidase domain-containing protein [bacterium]
MFTTVSKPTISVFHRLAGVVLVIVSLVVFSGAPAYALAPVIEQGKIIESPFTKIYEKVAPSIVRIDVKAEITESQQDIPAPFRQFFGVPQQQQHELVQGMGSGVIIDRDGHVLTNHHVIDSAEKITVKLNENESYDAKVVGTDPETDIAVIQMELKGKKLPEEYVAELGNSDSVKPGDYAIAIGNPIGLERTINVGVVSAVGRHGFNVAGSQSPQFQNYIQTDAQINPGNSGGALVDIDGKVIGINDMYTAQYAGIGFAIPVNLARNVMTQLIAKGEVKRGFVGIRPEEITKEIQEAMNLPGKEGVLIKEILPDTPAAKAGLKHGDVIVTLDGKKVKDFQSFLFEIGNHAPGDTVNLGYIRESKDRSVKLTLSERPAITLAQNGSAAPGDNGTLSWRGIHVVDIGSPAARDFNLGDVKYGVVVVKIDENSPAVDSNLNVGDVIVEIDSKEIRSTKDFAGMKDNPVFKNKTILLYRERFYPDGQVDRGFVAVKSA